MLGGRSKILRFVVAAVAHALRPAANEKREPQAVDFDREAAHAAQRKLLAFLGRNVEHPLDRGINRRIRRIAAARIFGLVGLVLRALLRARSLFGLLLLFGFERLVDRGLLVGLYGSRLGHLGLDRRLRPLCFGVDGCGDFARRLDEHGFGMRVLTLVRNKHVLGGLDGPQPARAACSALFTLGAPVKKADDDDGRQNGNDDGLVLHG